MQITVKDIQFYEFKRYHRNKKPYQRKTGKEKETFEQKVERIKQLSQSINEKLK